VPIDVVCASCQKGFRAPDQAAGRKIKCPACAGIIEIAPAGKRAEPSSKPKGARGAGRPAKVAPRASDTASQSSGAVPVGEPVPAQPQAPRTRSSLPQGQAVQANRANVQWHVQTEEGDQYGPISRTELDQWVSEGRLTGACQVLQAGWEQWRWAGEIYPQLVEGSHVGGQTAASDDPFAAIGGGGDSSVTNYYASPQSASTSGGNVSGEVRTDTAWYTVRTGLSIASVSLIIGIASFFAVSIGLFYMMNATTSIGGPSGGQDTAYLMMVMMLWGMIGVYTSSISLMTGWCVCLQAPRRSNATTSIQGAIGAIGVAILLAFLATLIPLGMMGGRMRGGESMGKMLEILPWLIQLVVIGSFAFYGFFLGAVGRFFHHQTLPQLAVFYAIFQGANATWSTISWFVLETDSKTMAITKTVIFVLVGLIGYAWLIYMTSTARDEVRRHLARG
jgi:hypothetical protein